jgi:photosystem II stability/assembly factor-like uncharacterized protein
MKKLIPVDVSQLFKYFLVILFCFNINLTSQPLYNQITDSTKDLTRLQEKPIQYRRGIGVQEGYQSYDEKYFGKNLSEEKRSLFPLQSTGIWTELNPKVPRVDYFGIQFVNKDTGWACGDLGALIKTTNGGADWTVSQTNTTTPILKVKSFNGQTVIASGYDGLILRSVDYGETFTQIISGVGNGFDLWGLEIVNDTLGWACGATTLLKTTDAGESWQIVNIPGYTGNLWWIDFLNVQYGFVAADGKVLKTTDGGINWEIIQAGDSVPLYCIDVIDSLHIAAAGYGGTNYSAKNLYSSDGGNNWIVGDTLTTESVNCIQFINPDTGYVLMTNSPARKTTNRGQEWTTIGGINDNYELQLLEKNKGYSVGTQLKINKTADGYENWKRLITNDNFSDVFFTSENKGFAISSYGFSNPSGLYKTLDGGINWEKVVGAPDGTTLLFLDSLTGFIGTSQINKTTNGGINWYIPNGGQGGAGKIFFIDETIGWAIRSNVIYKTTDRGENWFVQFTAPSSITFNSIHFIDSLYGWTANFGGRPYKTTNGGTNWVQQTNLDIWLSKDVLFNGQLKGFLLESNKLYQTTNGGLTFNLIPEITGYSVAGKFRHFNDSTIFITGYRTFRSLDAGDTWIDFPELSGTKITGVSLLGKGFGYATGDLGLILKYNDTSVPVELTSFTSSVNENDVILSWQTATEINNQGFQIERRETKNERSEEWNAIGFVSGNGTTTETQSYSFIDKNLEAGKYQYRLKQMDYDGKFEYSKTTEVEIGTPNKFSLEQNYPNPFNPSTSISWHSPISGWQKIKLYNALGEEVETILNEYLESGFHSKLYIANSTLPSGVYFYKLTIGGTSQVRKMLLTK